MENGVDEDEILDESIGEVERPVKLRTKPSTRPEGRAPTMTIEAVRIGRPMKVLALLASLLSLIMFISGAASTFWLIMANNVRIGIFQQCDPVLSSNSVDTKDSEIVCTCEFRRTWEQWACLILVPFTLLITLVAVILMIHAQFTLVIRHKYNLYKAVLILNALAWILMLTAVILLPLSFYYRWDQTPRREGLEADDAPFTLGWSHLVSACGLLPLFVAIILLAKDRKSEEVIYQETIFQDSVIIEDPAD